MHLDTTERSQPTNIHRFLMFVFLVAWTDAALGFSSFVSSTNISPYAKRKTLRHLGNPLQSEFVGFDFWSTSATIRKVLSYSLHTFNETHTSVTKKWPTRDPTPQLGFKRVCLNRLARQQSSKTLWPIQLLHAGIGFTLLRLWEKCIVQSQNGWKRMNDYWEQWNTCKFLNAF